MRRDRRDIRVIANHVGADPTALERLIYAAEAHEASDVESIDADDDRPYAGFDVERRTTNALFPYEVTGYSSDDEKLMLPEGVKAYYASVELARVAKMCLGVLAIGHTKAELDAWHMKHPALE